MSEFILHHYEMSPYSEKMRLIFGYKGLSWRSVIQPMMMPKPDLVALTGGYRRIPVLQIGADIYCDTSLIAAEIDRRAPSPPLHPAGEWPWGEVVASWADQCLFTRSVSYALAANADVLPDAFLRDRAAMMRKAPPDREQLKAGLPHEKSQLVIALEWLNTALSRRAYVGGDHLSGADFAVYPSVWMLAAISEAKGWMPAGFPALIAWMKRVAVGGHGAREEMDVKTALGLARAAEPMSIDDAAMEVDSTGIAPGDTISVTPESWGTESVTGTVVALDRVRVILALTGEEVGKVHVHFPRHGYVLARSPVP